MPRRKREARGTIYVLRLEGGYYYIGYTRYFQLRMRQHFEGRGAKFTQLHKPIEIVETLQNRTKRSEHSVTKRYIRKYGVDKVRGGDWCGTTPNSYCPYYYLPKRRGSFSRKARDLQAR